MNVSTQKEYDFSEKKRTEDFRYSYVNDSGRNGNKAVFRERDRTEPISVKPFPGLSFSLDDK